jgi:hypothetical protein
MYAAAVLLAITLVVNAAGAFILKARFPTQRGTQ